MMTNSLKILITVVAILAIAACKSTMTIPTTEQIEQYVWQLDSLNGEAVIAGTSITMTIRGQKLGGSGGANRYNAQWQLTESDLAISPIAATKRMLASPKGVMEQEQNFFGLLQKMQTVSMTADKQLRLESGEGQYLLFIPQPEL